MKYSDLPTYGRILGRVTFQSFFKEADILELYITDATMKEGLDIHMNIFNSELLKYLKGKE